MTSCAVTESSAPVGSSASTTRRAPTSARAIAARCRCPPDTSSGNRPAASSTPTSSERGQRLVPGRAPRQPVELQGERDVLGQGQRAHEVQLLEHVADRTAPDRRQAASGPGRPARGRRPGPGPGPGRRARRPRAAGSTSRSRTAPSPRPARRGARSGHPGQGDDPGVPLAVGAVHVVELEQRCGSLGPPGRRGEVGRARRRCGDGLEWAGPLGRGPGDPRLGWPRRGRATGPRPARRSSGGPGPRTTRRRLPRRRPGPVERLEQLQRRGPLAPQDGPHVDPWRRDRERHLDGQLVPGRGLPGRPPRPTTRARCSCPAGWSRRRPPRPRPARASGPGRPARGAGSVVYTCPTLSGHVPPVRRSNSALRW